MNEVVPQCTVAFGSEQGRAAVRREHATHMLLSGRMLLCARMLLCGRRRVCASMWAGLIVCMR